MYRDAFLAGHYQAQHPRTGALIAFWAEPCAVAGATFMKAANAPDERWITLKPHGPEHEAYVHVKIRQHTDGTASIIHGPGELRGLRLNKMAPGNRERRAATRQDRKQRLRDLTPEQKRERGDRERDLRDRLASVTTRAATLARAFAGEEHVPEAPDDDSPSANLRAVQANLARLERRTITALAHDSTLRDAILDDGASVPAEDVPGALPSSSAKRGYAYSPRAQAEQRGFTRDDARREDDAFFQTRIDQMLKTDPVRAARMIEARERMLAKRAERDALPPTPATPEPPLRPEGLLARAAEAREYLVAMRDLRSLRRELRLHTLALDPAASKNDLDALTRTSTPPEGSPWDVHHTSLDPAFVAGLEAQIEKAAAEDLTRAFLDAASGDDTLGWGADRMRDAMRAPHAAGAYAHLNNLAIATYGQEVLDRATLDALGVNASTKLMARHLARALPSDDLAALRDGLAKHHDQHSLTRMSEAMQEASSAREAAASMPTPSIEAGIDAVVARRLIRDKRDLLERAHTALGNALGEVEAGAALNFALMRPPSDTMLAHLGNTDVEKASTTLRALGLGDDHYVYHRDSDGDLWANINGAGMDALTPTIDPAERDLAEHLNRIKDGAEDEHDWLPSGFTRYPASAFDANPPLPEHFATSPLYGSGEPDERALNALASRLADGWNPAEARRNLTDQSTLASATPTERDAVHRMIDAHMPLQDEDGNAIDYAHLRDKHPERYERLMRVARDWMQQHKPESLPFADQTLDDTPAARQALHAAILEDPRTQIAHKPIGEWTNQDYRAARSYFLTAIAGRSGSDLVRAQQAAATAVAGWEQRNPMPKKFVGAFGQAPNPYVTIGIDGGPDEEEAALNGMGLTDPERHYVRNDNGTLTLTDEGKRVLRPPREGSGAIVRGLDELNSHYKQWHRDRDRVAADASNPDKLPGWHDFVHTAGGRASAYRAIAQHMQGAFTERFARYHANVTGAPLRFTVAENDNGEALFRLSDPQAYAAMKALYDTEKQKHRKRVKGRYAAMGGKGSLMRRYREEQEKERALQAAQSTLFSMNVERPMPIPHAQRLALAPQVEARIAGMTRAITGSVSPTSSPVHLIPDVTMGAGTKFVKQQRAIKANLAAKRFAAFLGVGAGKTAVGIGTFTELHHQGKARKGFFVVPSIVRDQFGEEMARLTEPGKYGWHAGSANFEERLAHYRDPSKHMVSVTHQSFRDDMMRLVRQAHGYDSDDEASDAFLAASPSDRKRLLKKALDDHQIPLDYIMMDEAHDSLDRAGKAESLLTAVTQAAGALSPYTTLATGTPVKNDASEVHSWLAKLDPERFGDRDAFMRKYGADVHASREALKRLMARYSYTDVVPSGGSKSVTWGRDGGDGPASPSGHQRIALTPHQNAALSGVRDAYEAARRARQNGSVDVDAVRVLSPASFEGRSDEEAQQIAERLTASLGALRHAAEARVVNETPPEHNAKMQHVLTLADSRRGRGGVIFAHNRASVQHLTSVLERAGHKVGVITGSDDAHAKAQVRNAFNRGDIDILVASDAAATGANFQKRGEWLVNYDLPLTYKTLEQRNGRIDRLGQKRHIELHHLITDADHDQDNLDRLERKRALAGILQGAHESLDDTGLAKYLNLARESQPPTPPEPSDEQGGMFA
jgi:hypothetical protein